LREWRVICARAVADAKDGNAAARDWLSRHLLGDQPLALVGLIDEIRTALEKARHVNGRIYQAGMGDVGGARANGAD
jgi:hypothetical protein